jgi:adenylosuccinate synthase
MPYSVDDGEVEPVYITLPGWGHDLTGMRSMDELPSALHDYIAYIERELGVPIAVVSVGPDRTQTIVRSRVTA